MIIVWVGLAVAVILAVCTLRLVGFVLWVVCMAARTEVDAGLYAWCKQQTVPPEMAEAL